MIDVGKVAALLLAAGRSERFGADKLLVPIDGVPIGLRAARQLAALDTGWRIAVCREGSALIAGLSELGFEILLNREPERGLSSSLALATERAEALGADALLVALADMPFVGRRHLASILGAFDARGATIVASETREIVMPPAVFGSAHFAGLQRLSGDEGARRLLAGAVRIAAEPGELADIDMPQDLP